MPPNNPDSPAMPAGSRLRQPVLSGFAAALMLIGAVAGWSLFAELGNAAAHVASSARDGAGPGSAAAGLSVASRQAAEAELRFLIAQLGEELAMQRALLQSAKVQRAFNETERAHVERLYEAGYARLPRLLQLQLAAAGLEDREAKVGTNIERLGEALAAANRDLEAAQAARGPGGALADADTAVPE